MSLTDFRPKFLVTTDKKVRQFLGFILIIFGFIFSPSLKAFELKTGDILLQPLHCWTCSLIEAQERSIYSHMGVYLKINDKDYVLEAFGKVQIISLADFLQKTQKDQDVLVKRFKNIKFDRDLLIANAQAYTELEYDSDFIWDNYDVNGNEKLYCSELVYKLFDEFYEGLPIKRMLYDINREHWIRYFRGDPPDGKWGNSPADFDKSDLLYPVGILK